MEAEGAKAKEVLIVVCDNVEEFYLDLDTCKVMCIVSKEFPHPMPKVSAIATNSKQAKIWNINNRRRASSFVAAGPPASLGGQDWPPAEV